MKARIYRQTKSAMQSGKQNAKKWLLVVVEENNSRSINPLMGWVSSSNTQTQLKFEFQTQEDAIKFAHQQNFDYEVIEPQNSTIKPKSYAANFTG